MDPERLARATGGHVRGVAEMRFFFEGRYRHQSVSVGKPAALGGTWVNPASSKVTSDTINGALRTDPLYVAGTVNLRAADVDIRRGAFTGIEDALYYRESFVPRRRSDAFPCDIVDVSKLRDLFAKRRPYTRALFGNALDDLERWIPDVAVTAAAEYHCHEGGHALGWPVEEKYRSGYFKLTGATTWPLVFVEEFRADCHSLGYAVRLLSRHDAAAVFAYHVLHRFGLAASSVATSTDSAGAVPFLLFSLLVDLGFLRHHRGDVAVEPGALELDVIVETMIGCASHAAERLTAPEMSCDSAIDVAIGNAAYYRRRMLEGNLGEGFAQWISSSSG